MKISLAMTFSALLLPLFVGAAGGPIAIASLNEEFVITGDMDTIPVGATINKGLWDGPISRQGGQLIVSASSGGRQIAQIVEHVFPSLHPSGKYGFGVVFDADTLRGETETPLTVRVEARNSNGVLIAYAELHGTLQPKSLPSLIVTLSPNTPLSALYERGSTWDNFTAITFTAGDENVGIQQLVLTRDGGNDNDLLNIRLFDGSTQIGMDNRFQNGVITIMLDAPFVIPKESSKTLMVKADIDQNADIYNVENGIAIGIANSSDTRAIGMETGNIVEPDDFAPVFGNRMGIP